MTKNYDLTQEDYDNIEAWDEETAKKYGADWVTGQWYKIED